MVNSFSGSYNEESIDFKIGDICRLKTGTSSIVVSNVKYYPDGKYESDKRRKGPPGWYIHYYYMSDSSRLNERVRIAKDFFIIKHVDNPEPESEEEMTNSLWQTKDEKFGVKCGENSEGKWLLEMKGSGEIKVFDKEELTEVIPHTVECVRSFNPSSNNPTMHFKIPKGAVAINDILMDIENFEFWRVTALDTKCRKPKSTGSKGLKKLLLGEETYGL